MMGLLTTGAPGFASLCATAIGRFRQLVSGVVNYIPLGARRRNKRLQTRDAFGKNDNGEEEKALDQPGAEKSAIGKNSDRRFSGQSLRRALERWA
jgi:hypothetical protein